jgi:WD40 repeat protein
MALSFDILISTSHDRSVKVFKLKDNNYLILQTLNYHKDEVYKIIELKNKSLVSCSEDNSIIFYKKDNNNNNYIKDYKLNINYVCYSVIETKDNEICYSECNYPIYTI